MILKNVLRRFLTWRIKHISNQNFVLLLSAVIGIIAGIAAITLKESVHFIQYLLSERIATSGGDYTRLAYPAIGILLTVLFSKYFLKEKLGHGITDILYAISKKSSIIARSKMYSRMITSALTVGFGGSVGLEAPIVVTGSAIGSNVAHFMHLDYKKRTLLIGCGSAGAIAAIFNSPVAGVIFSMEVILSEVAIASFIPLLIASVFGSLVSLIWSGENILFSFELTDPFSASDVPFYILLGLLCGIVSVYFTRMTYRVEASVGKLNNDLIRALVGGLILGLIIFLFRPVYGEGYDSIKALLSENGSQLLHSGLLSRFMQNDWVLIVFALGIILIKPVASAITIGSGGSGGIFAPSLFLGGVTGFLFAKFTNVLAFGQNISLSNFTLVGMCGVLSGILHAPLTAIFLIAEITSGYTLFIPLMLVSAISYYVTAYFEKYSIYTNNLIKRGDLIQYDKDRKVLSLLHIKKIIEKDLSAIGPEKTLGDLVNVVRLSRRNIFPVLDGDKCLVGIVTLDDIREIMFDKDSQENVIISSIMRQPPATISSTESMQSVMNKFEKTGAWNLPVIDDEHYIGFVSKSRIFNAYRKMLISQNVE